MNAGMNDVIWSCDLLSSLKCEGNSLALSSCFSHRNGTRQHRAPRPPPSLPQWLLLFFVQLCHWLGEGRIISLPPSSPTELDTWKKEDSNHAGRTTRTQRGDQILQCPGVIWEGHVTTRDSLFFFV